VSQTDLGIGTCDSDSLQVDVHAKSEARYRIRRGRVVLGRHSDGCRCRHGFDDGPDSVGSMEGVGAAGGQL